MKIERFFPSAALMPFVKQFIIVESELETAHPIIPDTSLVMAFRYRGNVFKMEGERKEVIPAGVVTGLRRSARLLYYTKDSASLLVLLNEGGVAAFSKIPAHELFGLSIPAENLFSLIELNETLDRLAAAKSSRARIDVVETLLLKKLTHYTLDPLIYKAVGAIKATSGVVRINELSASLHTSQDPFEKKFRALIGATPKQYASIIRLRSLISRYPTYASLTEASYEAGYFDQSHFIKDFRQFTGQTPGSFFKSSRYW
jgi:AraC-like DNA-binding protein